jgi:hypothetical protein
VLEKNSYDLSYHPAQTPLAEKKEAIILTRITRIILKKKNKKTPKSKQQQINKDD